MLQIGTLTPDEGIAALRGGAQCLERYGHTVGTWGDFREPSCATNALHLAAYGHSSSQLTGNGDRSRLLDRLEECAARAIREYEEAMHTQIDKDFRLTPGLWFHPTAVNVLIALNDRFAFGPHGDAAITMFTRAADRWETEIKEERYEPYVRDFSMLAPPLFPTRSSYILVGSKSLKNAYMKLLAADLPKIHIVKVDEPTITYEYDEPVPLKAETPAWRAQMDAYMRLLEDHEHMYKAQAIGGWDVGKDEGTALGSIIRPREPCVGRYTSRESNLHVGGRRGGKTASHVIAEARELCEV